MKSKLNSQCGASAVEFAIILPLLLFLSFAVIESGIALYDKALITNASREGARAGIVFRYPPLSDEEIVAVVEKYLGNCLITFRGSPVITTRIDRAGYDPGDELKVTVSFEYCFLLLPSFIESLGAKIPITAETVMRME